MITKYIFNCVVIEKFALRIEGMRSHNTRSQWQRIDLRLVIILFIIVQNLCLVIIAVQNRA